MLTNQAGWNGKQFSSFRFTRLVTATASQYSAYSKMKVLQLCSLLIFTLLSSSQAAEVGIRRYDGYQVIRARAETSEQYEALVSLYNGGLYDFWAGPSSHGITDILASPERRTEIENYLRLHSIPFMVHIQDLQEIISTQRDARVNTKQEGMNWEDYQLIETIYEWLDTLVAAYPELISIQTIGQSTEGRDIKVLKISTGGSNKTAFWIDSTIHAREWVSTSTVTYIINELVTKSSDYADLLSTLDFYIVPIINPDGYVYTHTTDRMWRKTRSDHSSAFGCRGVDANRNFGFHWGEAGSSSDKCSETYRGPNAYSEPEAEAIKNFIESVREEVDWGVYITLHSYSQLWMTPWGYSYDLPEGYDEMNRLGLLAAQRLESLHGTEYTVGSAANVLYASSGSSRDWAKGEEDFKYVYTIELRDKGNYGFLLPKEQIIPTAEETWAGLQVVAQNYLPAS